MSSIKIEMIEYKEFFLDNGLQVIVHEDHSIPIAAVNLLYKVGSKDEFPEKTGFAHLFEHLMFGGSKNILSYDEPLQKVGGENNAFTNPDITNYYITLPAVNLETAFWLESDRMLELSFDGRVLEVQKSVVMEEFKQRYLNQPYGDVWLKFRPLTYKAHHYMWPTIGREISHIEDAKMDDVKSFFYKFYRPNNAILVVAGHVSLDQVKKLTEKWFGPIPKGSNIIRTSPVEPEQTELRRLEFKTRVPLDSIYLGFHMPARIDANYHTYDLITDILGKGKSSRLYHQLIKTQKLFNSVNAYITGSIDPGLLVISGKLNKNIDIQIAEEVIIEQLDLLTTQGPVDQELEKVKNQAESTLAFSEVEILNKAMNLAYFAYVGNAALINQELDKIRTINGEDIRKVSNSTFRKENTSIFHYLSDN